MAFHCGRRLFHYSRLKVFARGGVRKERAKASPGTGHIYPGGPRDQRHYYNLELFYRPPHGGPSESTTKCKLGQAERLVVTNWNF